MGHGARFAAVVAADSDLWLRECAFVTFHSLSSLSILLNIIADCNMLICCCVTAIYCDLK